MILDGVTNHKVNIVFGVLFALVAGYVHHDVWAFVIYAIGIPPTLAVLDYVINQCKQWYLGDAR